MEELPFEASFNTVWFVKKLMVETMLQLMGQLPHDNNASNFVGVQKELQELYILFKNENQAYLLGYTTQEGIVAFHSCSSTPL
ncbi:hypothetical protein PR048_011726 [Dryococelus australis]|uniref:Uncharacterized protein n=1 Tax=Dryococelus australis TaxID=614101 RepID=A0ABQ9HMF6_9NEOP|nr:hypothetical protein PR048_011726 [Dryococelus australis]